MNAYVASVIDYVKQAHGNEPEFVQTVEEVLSSVSPIMDAHPEYEKVDLLKRMVEPERMFTFRVCWMDDKGEYHTNRGWRCQFNGAIGPYKGGLRFQKNVYEGIIKFLGFEQTFKNSLTGLPMGGAKGGSDFDPAGKSDAEVMRFCQSFMTALYRYIGPDIDVPAGDMGVGGREIGYLYGQYRRLKGVWENGVLTGKGMTYGGSLIRPEATGYGAVYYLQEVLKHENDTIEGKRIAISGYGNVAWGIMRKATELGAKVTYFSGPDGYIYDPDGVDIKKVMDIKQKRRARISVYADEVPGSEYHEGRKGIWTLKCDIAMPCASQNEMDADDVQHLIDNGCMAVFEGANMPLTPEAIEKVLGNGLLYSPGKASNAGGVATSGLEMSQNSIRMSWSFDEVDEKLHGIMKNIFKACYDASVECGQPGNLMLGANVAGCLKVADAMMAQGVV